MKVLVACEYSGTVRDAFIARGHDAMSCDLLPTDAPGPHHQGNVLDILGDGWDLLIAHPPCTHLACSGAVWFPAKIADGRQAEAIAFCMQMALAPIPHICVENPVCIMSTAYKPPTQIIHPWQFGHSAMKTTCLWLKGLRKLRPTNIVDRGNVITHESGKRSSQWSMDTFKLPKSERWKVRSKTFQGIADAMADQWGSPEGLIPHYAQAQMDLA